MQNMLISEGEKKIVLKKNILENLDYYQKAEFSKKNAMVSINPTRIGNIMIFITYDSTEKPTEPLIVIFSSHKAECSSLLYLTSCEKNEENGRITAIITNITGNNTWKDDFANKIYFSCNELENDFQFDVKVYKKWCYKICSGNLNHEFYYNDGQRHHELGDSIEYDNYTELFVMDIDTENYFLYCSSIRILH
jgi:hypothetical protein